MVTAAAEVVTAVFTAVAAIAGIGAVAAAVRARGTAASAKTTAKDANAIARGARDVATKSNEIAVEANRISNQAVQDAQHARLEVIWHNMLKAVNQFLNFNLSREDISPALNELRVSAAAGRRVGVGRTRQVKSKCCLRRFAVTATSSTG